MEIRIMIEGSKIVAIFQFQEADVYYAWETVRNFARTLKQQPYNVLVTYPEKTNGL